MSDSPILYIEELTRLPLRPPRALVPGCAHVYLGRGGRLYCPAGGLTTGELWWLGPRLVYGVDVTRHPVELTVEVSSETGRNPVDVELTASWQVVDPVRVVAGRLFDVLAVARPHLLSAVRDAALETRWRTGRELARALGGSRLSTIDLAEGVRIDRVRAAVAATDDSQG
jgi:hypothetical protein